MMRSVTFATLKKELKQRALQIRQERAAFKEAQRQGVSIWKALGDLGKSVHWYRHHHIVYCLLRGRTQEQIEKPVRDFPDQGLIDRLLQQYRDEIDKEMGAQREALLLGTG
jgi:ATP/maltotriose-dependent transcriptional regulator MalT